MIDIEVALDFLRAEGWGAPVWGRQGGLSAATPIPEPGRFVNRCDRCLEFRQASLVKMGSARAWLCEPCRSPNPPVVVIEQPQTWAQILKARNEVYRSVEQERRKIEREEARKTKHADLSRLRKRSGQEGNPKDAIGQGTQGTHV